jgi:negative regulator of sigma E activity
MKFITTFFLTLAMLAPCKAQNPSARQILDGAKMVAALQQADLEGTMTKSRVSVPIGLFLREKNIQFQYSDGKKWSIFHMRMSDANCELFRMDGGKQVKFAEKQLAEPIMGTDLTYEDLSFRFFYWKDPTLEGEENVGVHGCYKLRINNPGVGGAYHVMYVWVHRKFGAFMKIEGFDKQGKPLKRFLVTDVMQIGKDPQGQAIYSLQQMNVSSLNPENGRVLSETKLLFNKPKNVKAPAGPR